jgi:tetratricopeptide (TPR) repeat protein
MRTTAVTLALLALLAPIATAQPSAPSADEVRLEAAHLIDDGRYDEAIAQLRKLLETDPADAHSVYELGLAYSAKGDAKECRDLLTPVANAAGPIQVLALGMLGTCLDQLGDRKAAIAAYRRGLKLDPDDSQLTFNLAVTLGQNGSFDEARTLLERDTRHHPSHAAAYFLLGQIFETQNFRVPAILAYLRYLAYDPSSDRATHAAEQLHALVMQGVEKNGKNMNITIDPHPRIEEGDYRGMSMMLGLLAGGRDLPEEENRSEFVKEQTLLATIVHSWLESTETTTSYTEAVQRPFFAAMKDAKALDGFLAFALSSRHLPGMEQWQAGNQPALRTFVEWMKPQMLAPSVALP